MEENKNNLEAKEKIEAMKSEMAQEIHQEEVKELLKDYKEEKGTSSEAIIKKEENNEEVEKAPKSKLASFFARLIAMVLDQTILIGLSFALLYLFELVLKPVGLMVVDRPSIYFIIFVKTNILYGPIMESTKLKKTLGKFILKI